MDALLQEVNLQLRLLPNRIEGSRLKRGSSSTPSSTLHVDDVDANHSYGEILRHLACNLQSYRSSEVPQHSHDLYASVFWQLPAFLNGGTVIKSDVVKYRIKDLQQHRTTAQQFIDDIWNFREVNLWILSRGSPMIMLEGDSQSLERLERFGVLVVEQLEEISAVMHLLSPLPADVSSESLEGSDFLRQLTVQCLRLLSLDSVNLPKDPDLLASIVSHFKSGQIEDWFSVIEKILSYYFLPVSIVINTEVLQGRFRDASSWPARFSRLCRQLGNDGMTLRVMIISGRQICSETYDDIPIVEVMSHSVQLRHAAKEGPSDQDTSTQPWVDIGGRGTPVNKTLDRDTMIDNGLNVWDFRENDSGGTLDGRFQATFSDSLHNSANKWFNRLESQTHEFLYNCEEPEARCYKPLKIAILDTGFAYTATADKKALNPYRQRIEKFVNFHDDQGDSMAMCDPSGHGTAVAVQVLKTSHNSVLYICRIAGLRQNEGAALVPNKAAVVTAIRKAAGGPDEGDGGWGVDIINMSFGWPHDDDKEVREALRYARERNVILLASTSNEGLLGPPRSIMYPARDQNVIAIDAADGLGEKAPTSASSSSGAGSWDRRFSAPGMGLSSPHTKTLWTGSSFACAVATGVVALILEFARQSPLRKSQTVQSHLSTIPGITSILQMMSEKKGPDNFRFLLPWKVLGHPGEQRDQTSYRIVGELRKEFGREVGTEIYPLRRRGE